MRESAEVDGRRPAARRVRPLLCPDCREPLVSAAAGGETPAFDVLRCRCSAYPVVAGIPILLKGPVGAAGQPAAAVAALVEQGRRHEALQAMLMPPPPQSPSLAPAWARALPPARATKALAARLHGWALRGWRARAAATLAQAAERMTACAFLNFYLHRPGRSRHIYDYFAYRFGQPRHLVALSFADLIRSPDGPVLEVACGCGHITFTLLRRAAGQPVVGVDRSFFALFVAKTWLAPGADFVCCEADRPLPFADQAFAAIFSTDAFHYLADKATAASEMHRVLRRDGLLLLNVLRNARDDYPDAGTPLTPEEYQALAGPVPSRMAADSDVLERYLRKQGPALGQPASPERLSAEPLVSLAASRRPDFLQDYGPFEQWPHAEGRLRLNPLYVLEDRPGDETLRLWRRFPSEQYEQDNAGCKDYLPEQASISRAALADLRQGRRTPEIEALIGQIVILGVPERYM